MNLASTDTWISTIIEKNAFLITGGNEWIGDVKEKRKFIHFYGCIKYWDVFQAKTDEPHETSFGYMWVVGNDIKGGIPKFGDGRWLSEWVENPLGANKET